MKETRKLRYGFLAKKKLAKQLAFRDIPLTLTAKYQQFEYPLTKMTSTLTMVMLFPV